jgi:hypothetical protein
MSIARHLGMSRVRAAFSCAVLLLAPSFLASAHAQERPDRLQLDLAAVRVMSVDAALRGDVDEQSFPVRPVSAPRQSPALRSLYATTAVLQALDIHSTMLALDRGAIEANPLMAGVTKNRAAFIATKAAVATGTILAARRLSKRNKVAAIVTLVAINTAYGFIVQHNYKVARGLD